MKNALAILSIILLSMGSSCDKDDCIDKDKVNPDCICTMQYDPVCGCNGETYGNSCEAGCAGVTSYTKGGCE